MRNLSLLLALASFSYGAYLLQDAYRFVRRSIPATAEIVSLRTETQSSLADSRMGTKTVSSSMTIADLKYIRKDNGAEAFASIPWKDGSKAGQKVEILYDPGFGSHVVENAFWNLWGDSILGISAAFSFATVFLILKRKARPL